MITENHITIFMLGLIALCAMRLVAGRGRAQSPFPELPKAKDTFFKSLLVPIMHSLWVELWQMRKSLFHKLGFHLSVTSRTDRFQSYVRATDSLTKGSTQFREVESSKDGEKEPLPFLGSVWFKYQGVWIHAFQAVEEESKGGWGSPKETLSLHFLTRQKKVVDQFRAHVAKFDTQVKSEHIKVYVPRYSYWDVAVKRPQRPDNTLFYKNDVHQVVREDLVRFRSQKEMYEARGRIHKRGYLLSGVPGNGKTTLALWIAQKACMNIALMSCKVADDAFLSLCLSLPADTILVLEDIDTVVAKRGESKPKEDAPTLKKVETSTPDTALKDAGFKKVEEPATVEEAPTALSLGVLLSVLDGMMSRPGQITIMTTNHPEKLDPALLRKGRVGRHVVIEKPDHKAIRGMVMHHFPEVPYLQAQTKVCAMSANMLSSCDVEEILDRYDSPEPALDALVEESHERSCTP